MRIRGSVAEEAQARSSTSRVPLAHAHARQALVLDGGPRADRTVL